MGLNLLNVLLDHLDLDFLDHLDRLTLLDHLDRLTLLGLLDHLRCGDAQWDVVPQWNKMVLMADMSTTRQQVTTNKQLPCITRRTICRNEKHT
jgi:hypothetical protein